jgi:hypothetical protein
MDLARFMLLEAQNETQVSKRDENAGWKYFQEKDARGKKQEKGGRK